MQRLHHRICRFGWTSCVTPPPEAETGALLSSPEAALVAWQPPSSYCKQTPYHVSTSFRLKVTSWTPSSPSSYCHNQHVPVQIGSFRGRQRKDWSPGVWLCITQQCVCVYGAEIRQETSGRKEIPPYLATNSTGTAPYRPEAPPRTSSVAAATLGFVG
ncbi:hypothetical protein E3N88_42277 [Mikania micrantha]|uniref:Uncharacterized protein n=1 Tax=Mikania micrantha TaxID=192012 RepID=A0A5N6LIC9_9ASTR|nr:hypothetical protein E3N88_42277 [Mikania micrantha]